jgi:hypothetical protein
MINDLYQSILAPRFVNQTTQESAEINTLNVNWTAWRVCSDWNNFRSRVISPDVSLINSSKAEFKQIADYKSRENQPASSCSTTLSVIHDRWLFHLCMCSFFRLLPYTNRIFTCLTAPQFHARSFCIAQRQTRRDGHAGEGVNNICYNLHDFHSIRHTHFS